MDAVRQLTRQKGKLIMSIWFKSFSVEEVNALGLNTMVDHCGIKITEIREDELVGVMPVTNSVKQPFGIVHGGANCVLAETLGSLAANQTCNPEEYQAVGSSITTNHIKAVREGVITGIAKPVHLGRSLQVWEIKTFNDNKQLTSTTSFTVSILSKQRKI